VEKFSSLASDAGLVSKNAIGKKSARRHFLIRISLRHAMSNLEQSQCRLIQEFLASRTALSPTARQNTQPYLLRKTHTPKNAKELLPL
jgi:hypothetical protein